MKHRSQIMVGGQAVLEGVMMRSPDYVTVAVRRPNGKITLKKDAFESWTKRIPILGWPFIRGCVILIESLILGIRALNFSGNIVMEEENEKSSNDKKIKNKKQENQSQKKSDLPMILSFLIAFSLAVGLFFLLPSFLANLTNVDNKILYALVDGVIRLLFFLGYLLIISLWKDIYRIFQYHGAEHKSIFAYENNQPLTLEGVKSYKTYHPRCGTSFLLVVLLVSMIVFMPLGKPADLGARFIRLLFIPLIGGISYEIIRLSNTRMGRKIAQVFVAPGLWLQRITTKEPDDSQLEVALVALKAALNQDVGKQVEFFISENNGKN